MKKKQSRQGLLSVILVVVFLIAACSISSADVTKQGPNSKQVWELKLGSKMVENHLESQAVKKFIKLAEEKSGGKIKITPYFGEVLGDSKIQLENVSTGVQDFYVESYTFFANYVPEFRVHSLPWLFADNSEYQKFLLSSLEKEMEQKLVNKVGIRVINEKKNWLRGPYRILISRRPVKSLEDVKGLKLRQPDSPPTIKTWSALGANVLIIPYSETYLAVFQGMVDAVTLPIANLYSDKFYELLKHATVTHEYQQQVAIVMNEKKFQSMPQEVQRALIDAVNEAGDLCTDLVNNEGSQVREKLEKEEGVTFYEIDLAPWRKRAAQVHKELEESGFIPHGLLDKINEILSR